MLHGHKHRAFLWRVRTYEAPEVTKTDWDLGSINILGGGSAGSTRSEANSNYFHIFRYLDKTLEVQMFRSTKGGEFEKFACWTAEVGTPKPEHWIGPWKKHDC